MVLTLTGLGDESGSAFPFEVGVNGTNISGTITGFRNWNQADHGAQGENAPWSEMDLAIPTDALRAGTNEVTVFSRQPGDHGSGYPHMLLAAATLAPAQDAAMAAPEGGAAVDLLGSAPPDARGNQRDREDERRQAERDRRGNSGSGGGNGNGNGGNGNNNGGGRNNRGNGGGGDD
jgi:hypothetical protein